MKYLVIIDKKFPLNYEDKIVYFDTEQEAEQFIDGCYLVLRRQDMEFKPIVDSEINDNEFINYKDVHIM